ncbi:MAG: hypothetical protein WD097_02440 [Balneolales bacterium]
MKKSFQYGPWSAEYTLDDGARLNRMCYQGFDLLTTAPENFRRPSTDYGDYENRPVYGYDDCFPSVEPCPYPGEDWRVPDHGELYLLDWVVTEEANRLIFTVDSKALPVRFKRDMQFTETGLKWRFEVTSEAGRMLPFQHVIHPLMKLDDISDVRVPPFGSVNDEKGNPMNIQNPESLRKFLLSREKGQTHMLFLQRIKEGRMHWKYKNNLHLEMKFPLKYFPTMGIWWNNSGYPDEDGCRRNECAFEPVPGTSSRLSETVKENNCFYVSPGETFSWEISWQIKANE